uniref:NADH-ubiquinone oxidoreductase chain 6 n=1 Tax=Phloiophilus edwardsi TaxID=295730 RepID=A0A0S2MR18_9CUCU|nr:NADH deshydrogenase subunit 6 [Phloiophilus edwardsi]
MIMMINFSLIMAMLFTFTTHPMSMGFMLLMQTFSLALIIGFMNLNFWYSYILFIVMVGGMMVVFIYMTSIASNEKFKFSNKLFLMFIMLISISLISKDLFILWTNYSNMEIFNWNNNMSFNVSMSKYMSYPNNSMFYLTMLYLLIALIIVVKIANINYGPLQMKI